MQDLHSEHTEPQFSPEEKTESRNVPKNLFVRNILNLLFIIMALVTMGSIGFYLYQQGETPMWCYLLGVVAVIIKMCESLLRMPGWNKSGDIRTHRRSGR